MLAFAAATGGWGGGVADVAREKPMGSFSWWM